MAVRLTQGMRLQQKMAPQLIYSLQLLQMPSMELELLVRQALETNPVLEESDDAEEVQDEAPAEETDAPDQDEMDWDSYFNDGFELVYGDSPHEYDPDADIEPRENRESTPPTLSEHLIEQLHLATQSEREREIGEYIIGNIDDDGYLTMGVEDLVKRLEATPSEVESVLRIIQQFDPTGVGARDLKECLTIQLRDQGYDEETAEMQIVADHLDDFLKKRYRVLSSALDLVPEDLEMACDVIARLNIRPAANFSQASSNVDEVETALGQITPDIVVEKVGDDYVVLLTDSFIPSLRISSAYRSMLRNPEKVGEDARHYIVERLNDARWLINSIEQRRSTILKVANYIVSAQREFFEHGVSHLRPMVLQEAADAVGMHVATISRVTNGKYMQTPFGVFELKYFFDGRVGVAGGQDIAARSVKDRIRHIVEGEDQRNPLNDESITEILRKEGIDIARRTVAKYREQLSINPVKYRKKG